MSKRPLLGILQVQLAAGGSNWLPMRRAEPGEAPPPYLSDLILSAAAISFHLSSRLLTRCSSSTEGSPTIRPVVASAGHDTPYIVQGTIQRVNLIDEAGCAGQL
jgi:hypothetical protein